MLTRQGAAHGLKQTEDTATGTAVSPVNVVSEHRSQSSHSSIDDDAISSVSNTSGKFSVSSVRARARAEAAKAKLLFAKKQADLSKQNAERAAQLDAQKSHLSIQENTRKVHFEADMAILQAEQEAAVATVEEMVYESAECDIENQLGPTPINIRQRTEEYVKSYALIDASEQNKVHPVLSYTTQAPSLFQPVPPLIGRQSTPTRPFQSPAFVPESHER